MYSVIRNMRHARWLMAAAALALAAAAVQHRWTVSQVDSEYRNEPLARSLGMLMASLRPADGTAPAPSQAWTFAGGGACSRSELGRLDAGLARLDAQLQAATAGAAGHPGAQAAGNRRTQVAYVLDRRALDEQIELAAVEDADAQPFRCQSLVTAVDWMLRTSDGASRLGLIDWKALQESTAGDVSMIPWQGDRSDDPWRDLPGCVLVAQAGGYAAIPPSAPRTGDALCKGAFADGRARLADGRQLPIGMERLRAALAAASPATAHPGNHVTVLGRAVPQGPHYLTTLDASAQRGAQQAADCYTGQAEACAGMGIDPALWRGRREGAAVRMAGVLVMDIATGAIEAAASAHTRCFAQEFDGPGRDADCLALPTTPRYRPQELENHALFTSYMPGSLVKPILAMGLLHDPVLGPRLHGPEREQFLREIRRSITPAFLDRLFCRDTGFRRCARPGYAFDAATALGWNAHCGDGSDAACARSGAITGAPGEQVPLFTGLMGFRFDAAQSRYARLQEAFEPASAEECASRPPTLAWRRCKAGGPNDHLLDLESEAWGQGSARATPVGVAMMLSRLAAAANAGAEPATVPLPHLLAGVVYRREGELTRVPVQVPGEQVDLPGADARLVIDGMRQTHLPAQGARDAGTASSACVRVYGSAKACTALGHIAGKTGTPTFIHDTLTADVRLRTCAKVREELARLQDGRWGAARARWVDCRNRPIKWYAALLKDPAAPAGPWTKAIAVIVERNWDERGVIDSPHDSGPNTAAELAFQVIKRFEFSQPGAGAQAQSRPAPVKGESHAVAAASRRS